MPGTDHAIIARVVAGERRAYAELVDCHKDRAMTLAMRMLKNREDAEEAVQDAFVRAFHALGDFQWRSSFSTWFYRIVFNVCSSALDRRGKNFHRSVDDDEVGGSVEIAAVNGGPDLLVEGEEFRSIVQEEIEKLPSTYGAVITLFFVHELSYPEIAEVTALPLGTVKAKLFRGRVMLREAVLRRYGSLSDGPRPETVTLGRRESV